MTWLIVVTAVVGATVLGLATAQSYYPGEVYVPAATRTTGSAVVRDCRRTGLLSRYGVGRWWRCDATVSMADGRVVDVQLAPSVVTPGDRGHGVLLVELCTGRAGTRQCRYSRPGNGAVAVLMRMVAGLRWIVGLFGLLVVGLLLVRTVLGRRLYARVARVRIDEDDGGRGEFR